MYGTLMIGRPAVDIDKMKEATRAWADDRGEAVGFVDERVLMADDGRIAVAVRFASREDYERLAEDPKQDAWWSEVMAPMLDGEPEWIDGEWTDL
jgi:hypothetical protein